MIPKIQKQSEYCTNYLQDIEEFAGIEIKNIRPCNNIDESSEQNSQYMKPDLKNTQMICFKS
jgi:hypothetical protein